MHSGVQSEAVTRQYLLSVFSMRTRTWPGGQPIRVFVLPYKHSVHQDFSKNVLGIFPYQLRSIWDRALFSGAGQSPTVVPTVDIMLEKVRSTTGAIGYLPPMEEEVQHVNVLEIR